VRRRIEEIEEENITRAYEETGNLISGAGNKRREGFRSERTNRKDSR
jgi:hypothetical protein